MQYFQTFAARGAIKRRDEPSVSISIALTDYGSPTGQQACPFYSHACSNCLLYLDVDFTISPCEVNVS